MPQSPRQDPEAGEVGVTGAVAARVEAEDEIDAALPYVEIGTVAIVALVLGIALRSFLAPILTLFVPAPPTSWRCASSPPWATSSTSPYRASCGRWCSSCCWRSSRTTASSS